MQLKCSCGKRVMIFSQQDESSQTRGSHWFIWPDLLARRRNYKAYSLELPVCPRCLGMRSPKTPKRYGLGFHFSPYLWGSYGSLWYSRPRASKLLWHGKFGSARMDWCMEGVLLILNKYLGKRASPLKTLEELLGQIWQDVALSIQDPLFYDSYHPHGCLKLIEMQLWIRSIGELVMPLLLGILKGLSWLRGALPRISSYI